MLMNGLGGPAVLLPRQQAKLARGAKDKEHAISQTPNTAIAIDIGKNSFHVVGHDARGTIVLRQKWSRGQVEARLANLPPCLIGMEACVGKASFRNSCFRAKSDQVCLKQYSVEGITPPFCARRNRSRHWRLALRDFI